MTPGTCTWLTVKAVAKKLGKSEKFVRKLIDRGVLRHARLGRCILVEASWVDEAIIAHSTPIEVVRRPA